MVNIYYTYASIFGVHSLSKSFLFYDKHGIILYANEYALIFIFFLITVKGKIYITSFIILCSGMNKSIAFSPLQ